MKTFAKTFSSIAVATTATFGILNLPATAITLTNGSGSNTVSVGVDAFGSFGSLIFGDGTSNAFYTPADGGDAVGTVFQSGLLVRGISDDLTFLSSGQFYEDSGGTDEAFSSTSSNSAISSFRFEDLLFDLEQTLTAQLDQDNNQIGSVLTQTYTVTNTSNQGLNFDLFRFVQPTLIFTEDSNNNIIGGRIVVPEFGDLLFAVDTINSTIDPIIALGITATGGTVPEAGRYHVSSFDSILNNLTASPTAQLPNEVVYDFQFGNNDGILEVSELPEGLNLDFPLSLTLNNVFSLAQGETATYTARTIFGSFPATVTPQPVPEPSSTLGFVTLGALGIGLLRQRRQKQ